MKEIKFNASNTNDFKYELVVVKIRLVELCARQLEDRVCTDISVDRYNMARAELKEIYPVEVICMLDASGFINEILCPAEKAWIKERKLAKGGKR